MGGIVGEIQKSVEVNFVCELLSGMLMEMLDEGRGYGCACECWWACWIKEEDMDVLVRVDVDINANRSVGCEWRYWWGCESRV